MPKESVATDTFLVTISATESSVRLGDHVEPGTVVGRDPGTGEEVRVGVYGRVAAVHFSPADHCLMVLIKLEGKGEQSWLAFDLVAFMQFRWVGGHAQVLE